jgi:nucleotide-binding universal stress UspA family protein
VDVTVIPGSRVADARRLLPAMQARFLGADVAGRWAVDAALDAASSGTPVLLLPPGVGEPGPISTVLVPHEGSQSVFPGIDLAGQVARAADASVVVLHVSGGSRPAPGGLAAPRMADHAYHDWTEWRGEFARRFLESLPLGWVLKVATGPPAGAVLRAARELHADLIVAAWKGDARHGRARTMKALLAGAPCPVLLVLEFERAANGVNGPPVP